MEWINVDDQLPDSQTRKHIVWIVGLYWPSYMHVGVYREDGWDVGDSRVNGIVGYVTHWMPLPPPPEQNK